MSAKAYKFDAYVPMMLMGCLMASLPMFLMLKQTFLGGLDLLAASPGRLHLPYWGLLVVWMGILVYWLWADAIPAIRYWRRGHVFKIDDNRLVLGGREICRSEILSFRLKRRGWVDWNKQAILDTPQGRFRFHPGFHQGGCEIIQQFFDQSDCRGSP